MSARLLALVLGGQEAAALASMPALVAVARAKLARLRLAFVQPMPPPRVNRHDQVIADTDHEMTRLTNEMVETFSTIGRRFDDVTIDVVVRFGTPRREAAIEADVFEPTLIALFAARGGTSLSTWRLRRDLARRRDSRLLVLETERPATAWRRPLARPAWGNVRL